MEWVLLGLVAVAALWLARSACRESTRLRARLSRISSQWPTARDRTGAADRAGWPLTTVVERRAVGSRLS